MVGLLLLLLTVAAGQTTKLTAYEKAQGWRLLFDGATRYGWHGFKSGRMPDNWRIEDEALTCAGEPGPVLVSDETFRDFELSFHWKIAAGGRAELVFRLSEDGARPDETSPVFQLGGEGVECGGNGGLTKPWRETKVLPEVWHQAKLTVYGNQVEYWINGSQVANYLLDGAEWRSAVAASSFSASRDYGRLPEGAVALGGSGAAFRNIKLRML